MFFYASKLLWLMAEPSNLLLLLLGLGLALSWTHRVKFARRLIAASGLMLLMAGLSPLGALMMMPLEERFARPGTDAPAPAGIIVLGGGVDEGLTQERDIVSLTEAGSRMTEAVALARRFPQARLVFSGGSASILGAKAKEADAARRMWTELGIPPERMAFEDQSRNTFENAELVRQLVLPKPGETWWLLTSAYHMPRSVGIFRKIGFDVVPYPVDYRTRPWPKLLRPHLEASQNLALVDRATKEWIGLAAYWLSGRSSALFPTP